MYQRVCLLGPRFPEQLSPVSTMLSHLPRCRFVVPAVFGVCPQWLSSEGVLSPAPGAHNFSGSRLQQCAERAVDDSFRQHLLSSSFGVAPQMKTLRKRKVKNLPMISYPSVQPVHKLHCPTPRSGTGQISTNFIMNRTDFSKITGFIERHGIEMQ
ncbi:uncharacterized protein LOC132514334 isoform X4 [Lagenorhynchus albirostris]|uniref:uncharacterized protein LOC132514334 isoform X4 n=1 Tax=Lagenorhynchus albirostris TaxID=27610 RepID=UPI0028E1C2A3|nr:uncharacterized protein LOC132514334 isoform X4 [Lagenorhynchus albirostris]